MKKTDDMRLNEMGIYDGILFELRELGGIYLYNKERKIVSEIKCGCRAYIVEGLYENLLSGKYHIEAI